MGWQDAPVVTPSAGTPPPASVVASGGASLPVPAPQAAWMSAPVVPASATQGGTSRDQSLGTKALNFTPLPGAEEAMHVGSQIAAFPVEAAGSLYELATSPDGKRAKNAAETSQAIGQAMTYEPRTIAGRAAAKVSDAVLGAPGKFADWATKDIAENPWVKRILGPTGSEYAQAGADVAIQAIPAVLGGKLAPKGAEVADTPEAAAERAKSYVASHTALDWSALPDAFRKALTAIASDAKNLEKLDPEALQREARLAKLGVPATRGQITRDLPQLAREEAITKSDAGTDVRNINAEQDRVLHENLDKLRRETGGKAETRQQVGQSVQGSARAKLDHLRGDYQAAYQKAKAAGAGLEPADISPLREWLKNPTNARNAEYLKSAIADYVEKGADGKPLENGRVTINDLEEIRKEATANAKKPGPEGHFAKEATSVIDKILDDSGSAVYKDARTKFKDVKDEFDRQGRIAGLVKNKGYTRDRAVALEDTFDNVVVKGSKEQLEGVKKTLISGGRSFKGIQAWRDLQSSTIDYLKDAAAGKRAIPGEKNQLQFNSTFLDALHDLDKDGKIDVLFGPEAAAKIREIAEATRDVRTKPTGRISGSDTAPRILNLLEKLAVVPAGKYLAGAAKVVRKVGSIGEETRDAARAKSSPLEESARQAHKSGKHAHTLRTLGRTIPGVLTLRGEQQ
jgi:hypothetical protein